MSLRRTLSVLVLAVLVGLFFGVAFSGDEIIAVPIWVGAGAVVLIAAALRELLVASRIESASMHPAFEWIDETEATSGHRGVQIMRSLVASADTDPRTYSRHLKPHLVALAAHYMPRRHGLDVGHERERVEALLGDVAWMIDPAVDDRVPSHDDLSRFLSIVVGNDEVSTPDLNRAAAL